MNLDDLTAKQLAAIDSVCLEFENAFGSDQSLSIEAAIKLYIDRQSGNSEREHIELLRHELIATENELHQQRLARERQLESIPTPFQSKTGVHSGKQTPTDGLGPFPNTDQSRSALTEWLPQTQAGTSGPLPVPKSGNRSSIPAESQSPPQSNSDHALTGQSIGPYSIGRMLARGGMGVVYRALDTRLDRPVAIKMMGFPHLASHDPKRIELVERFEREAKAVAALSHPNIVELFDVGVAGSVPYAVMEFLSGLTLADQLVGGPMSAEQTCQIGMQIAGALATAHAGGVIHRDLKPQNVMLVDNSESGEDAGPRVKLVDFGLSRVGDAGLPGADPGGDPSQTRSGMILGTPGYMSPEQARGESATSAADMFGFGCVLYEVLFGKQAIPGETPADRLAGTLKGDVQYEPAECEQSRSLCELIEECLQKDPEQRPTASDVYGRLRQIDVNGQDSGGHRGAAGLASDNVVPDSWLRRHMLTTLAGGLLGGILGGLSSGRSRSGLGAINSIAVLTLRDIQSDNIQSDGSRLDLDGMPLADRKITEGDMLASALVNELSAVDGLTVLPYRPQSANTPDQYRKLGQELGVDAFLTGSFENQTLGQRKFWVLNWQLVSAQDGSQLIGEEFVTDQSPNNQGEQVLSQSAVASNVADQIGRALVTSGQKIDPPDAAAYGCMVKGHAYADADSTKGLRRALMCYNKAHEEDPRLSEPLAAIAVASLNLAARSDSAETLAHLEKATASMKSALELDPNSVDARLAKAMIEWQLLHHYEDAFRLFEELNRINKFEWQVQYQRGLLLATLGMAVESIDAMHTATKLNPMSMLIKTDRCRIDWFFNYDSRAMRNAIRYRDSTKPDNPVRRLAIGLLIDMYEHQGDFQRAGQQQGLVDVPDTAKDYYAMRETKLIEFPYGPFGTALNRAILDLRKTSVVDPGILGALNESGATMFPLLLARHPAFFDLSITESAADYLPSMGHRLRNA